MHIYAHTHASSAMTKVISLSENAYATLKRLKRPNESFSEVILRMSGHKKQRSILEFAGSWKGDDIDEVFSIVAKDRESSASRRIDL